jgi:hypothetical protein
VYLAQDLGYIDDQTGHELLAACVEVTRMIVGLRKSLGV